jgi:hypothetical protein
MLHKAPQALRSDPAIWLIAVLTVAMHMAFASRYDIFRNELYYIVCGRHPAFGYADEPPLVPLIAAATQVFGISVWALRLPAALAAGALVPVTAAIARLFGGGTSAAIAAALAASTAPALIALTQITTTSTFEPLGWSVAVYLIARAALRNEPRVLLWAGVAVGITLQAKYGIPFWLAGLSLGLLLSPYRVLALKREAWFAALIAVVIAAPSLIWQHVHGWPFIGVMKSHSALHSNFTGTPVQYEIGQVLAMNFVLAPLWIAGVVAPFFVQRLKPARFIAIGYVVTAALIIGLHGKDYYLFPAYPALFAVGAVAFGRLTTWVVAPWAVLAAASAAFVAPLALPMLDPPALRAYMDRYHLHPAPDEAAAVGAPLTQVYSDELGWRELEKTVAGIYHALPPEDQRRVAIIGLDYGEAAAIDVYGQADNLPPAISGQEQYWFWGPRGHDGSVVIGINASVRDHGIEKWRSHCAKFDIVARFGVPYAMPYENNRPIFICRGLEVPLTEAWPIFRFY